MKTLLINKKKKICFSPKVPIHPRRPKSADSASPGAIWAQFKPKRALSNAFFNPSLLSDHVFKSALDNWTNYRRKNIIPYFTSFYSPKRSFYWVKAETINSSILSELFHSPMAAPRGLLKIFQSEENSHLKLLIQYLGHHFVYNIKN